MQMVQRLKEANFASALISQGCGIFNLKQKGSMMLPVM